LALKEAYSGSLMLGYTSLVVFARTDPILAPLFRLFGYLAKIRKQCKDCSRAHLDPARAASGDRSAASAALPLVSKHSTAFS
jgi:hypothetical protein